MCMQCRVLLLSLQTQAAGLTLTRASHVFLLEPAMDPAIEQQVCVDAMGVNAMGVDAMGVDA